MTSLHNIISKKVLSNHAEVPLGYSGCHLLCLLEFIFVVMPKRITFKTKKSEREQNLLFITNSWVKTPFTNLCFTFHLLCLDLWTSWGERLQQVSYPGPSALSLGIEVITLSLKGTLGVCLLLQPGLQVSVALYQVITVLQKALCSDALSAYWGQQLSEQLSSATVTWKAKQIDLYRTFSHKAKTEQTFREEPQGNRKKGMWKIFFALWFMQLRLWASLVHLKIPTSSSSEATGVELKITFFTKGSIVPWGFLNMWQVFFPHYLEFSPQVLSRDTLFSSSFLFKANATLCVLCY